MADGISLDAIFNDALSRSAGMVNDATNLYNQTQQTFTNTTTSRRDINQQSLTPGVTWGNPNVNDPSQWANAYNNPQPQQQYASPYGNSSIPVNYGYGYGSSVYNNGYTQSQQDDASAGFASPTYGKIPTGGGY